MSAPACPQCTLENTYPDGPNFVCADCCFEWPIEAEAAEENGPRIVKDANGNVRSDGDSVVLIKDLKLKGSSSTMKVGTKIKSIRIVEGGHELDCKSDFGNIMLKACFVKKA
ncbi:MAG: Protein PhnA [Fluviibacter phosphoraccumulans EoVTN8]